MKRLLLALFFIINSLNVFGQNIEKIFQTKEIKTMPYIGEDEMFGFGLSNIYVEELTEVIRLEHYYNRKTYLIKNKDIFSEELFTKKIFGKRFEFKNKIITNDALAVAVKYKDSAKGDYVNSGAGISFILKKDNEYIVYYIDDKGIPGAIDTACNKYNSKDAIEYLKSYDPEKYKESRKRAEQLGLLEQFESDSVLVWGQTYYSTAGILEDFWKPDWYLYPNGRGDIQYDLSGIGYQKYITSKIDSQDDNNSQIVIVSQEGKWLNNSPINIHNSSTILVRHYNEKDESSINSEMVAGLSGNIYYYISDDKETEVFRIRNTWDSTNFYALAINGYTEDDYGKYVEKVLPTLSKSDLRLLRNTIFALYGVHFKSADLSNHFDKQVWYTDEGKTSADVTLPEHRQKLVEMIQKLEK